MKKTTTSRSDNQTRKANKKVLISVVIAALVLAIGTVVVFAYLSGKSESVNNKFSADSDPTLTAGESVAVNDSGYTVYIRAAVIVTWQKTESGETLIYATKPSETADYTITFANLLGVDADLVPETWTLGNDGFYYYTSPVANGASTKPLYNSVVLKDTATVPEGYSLKVEFATQAVQAIGTTDNVGSTTDNATYAAGTLAVVDAWKVLTAIYTDSAVKGTGTGADVINAKAKNGIVLIYKGNNVPPAGSGDGADPIDDVPDDIWG